MNRLNHVGARAGMGPILVELRNEIKLLDGITRYRFGMDPETMSAWRSAKRLGSRTTGPKLTLLPE